MKYNARQLAEALGLKLEGDGSVDVRGMASPERAGAHDLIYLESAKHEARVARSAALCILAPDGVKIRGKTILRCPKPRAAFAHAAALLLEAAPLAVGIHPTAIVSPSAQIGHGAALGPYVVIQDDVRVGKNTQIGPHCVVGCGSWIGDDCRLHVRVTLYPGVRLGHRVEVHSGTVIGSDGFGYAYDLGRYWKFPQIGIVEVGDDVEIGANTTIDRGALDDTRIADGVKIDNLVHVGHNVQIGAHTVIAAQTGISGSSVLGHHVVVGGQVGIADHCVLEDGAIAGAQAGIPTGKAIRSGQTVWGTPARPLEKFKQQYAWFARLPELGERVKALEEKLDRK